MPDRIKELYSLSDRPPPGTGQGPGRGVAIFQNATLRALEIACPFLLVLALGAAAALAAERRRLLRRHSELAGDSARQAETLGIVHRISREAARILDPDLLTRTVVGRIHEAFGYQHVMIMTYDPAENCLVFNACAGRIDVGDVDGYRQSVDVGLMGRAFRTGSRVLSNDNSSEPDFLERAKTGSELAIPLRNAGAPVGVLNIESLEKNAFDERFAQLMEILAEQIAPLMVNARLFREVAQGKREWERTFDAIGDPVALQDVEGRIQRANLAFALLCRLPVESLPGQAAAALLYGMGAPPPDDPIAATLRDGQPATAEFDLPHLGGRFVLDAAPRRTAEGWIEGVVLILRDVTRQRDLEMQALRSARFAAMGMLASGVAHDFNNLMAAILLRAEMLDRALSDPEQRHWVEVVARSARDGATTVQRMLDYARLQGDAGRTRVDVGEVVRQVVDLTRGRWKDEAQARGAEIRIESDLAAAPPVMANPSELREVFTNLVLNAVDALPSGGVLRLAARAADGRVLVEVSDDGVGIPPENVEKIFSPFFSTKGSRGTGLGLSVSAGILKRHGGDLRVASVPGRGTTFTVDLPAASGPVERPQEAALPDFERTESARILVVDDERDVREALADILRLHRHVVDEAPDGAAALDLASRTRYDLIVSDLGMPGMSGIEFLRRARGVQPDAATMLVTGWGQHLEPGRAREEGIDRILSKPVSLAELLRSVAEVLGDSREVALGREGAAESR